MGKVPLEKEGPTPVFLPGDFYGQRSLEGRESMGSQSVGNATPERHWQLLVVPVMSEALADAIRAVFPFWRAPVPYRYGSEGAEGHSGHLAA